jgi:hypothetical protein
MGAPRTNAVALGGPGQRNRAALRQRGSLLQADRANAGRAPAVETAANETTLEQRRAAAAAAARARSQQEAEAAVLEARRAAELETRRAALLALIGG